jgi:dTDP-4-amino-4,6-dideoxygalactose transaminase
LKIPFLDLKIQYQSIKDEINHALQQVLDNTSFVLGKSVSDFEDSFAQAHHAQHCIGLSSGTDGNHIVLWALGVGPGDEVIIPVNTFVATAWGATLCGAKPVFVDCEPVSYNIDAKKIEAAITPRTKAIVAVHLYGQPADFDEIKRVALKHNIIVAEDCAQSHAAEYKGKKVGTLGVASSFSFYPGKNLGAYGEAGAAMTNDESLAKTFHMIRDHGTEHKYSHEIYGHNYRMDGFQGAVLGVKLNYLSEWTEKRRAHAAAYRNLLAGIGDIILPQEMPYAKHVYHLFVIQTTHRDALQKYLTERGIGTGLHYPIPLHLQNCFQHLGYKNGDFPVAENLAKCCLSLPMFAELSDTQIEYVTSSIRSYFR